MSLSKSRDSTAAASSTLWSVHFPLTAGDLYSQAELPDQPFSAVGAQVGFGLEPLWRQVVILPVGCLFCCQTGCRRVLGGALIPGNESSYSGG